ncbi:MAG: DUF2225 domain-containing protein [Candidatus Magnetomorum sp.]|nr:DUF2225 domain-containing protein [Candidatus Magnetomorum sp.]
MKNISCLLCIISIIVMACAPEPVKKNPSIDVSQTAKAEKYLADARVLIKKDDISKALPLLQTSLSIYQQNNSSFCSEILMLLGDCYKKINQFEKSKHAFQSALEFDQKKFGQVTPYVSRDYNRLSLLYLTTSNYYQALTLIEKAIAIDQQLYSQPHFDTARDLTLQAILYERLGRYELAVDIQKKVLGMIQQIYGPRHEHTSAAINNLAASYVRLKNYEKAIPLFEKALLIDQTIQKNKKSDIARDLNNLGIVYRHTGKYEKSRDYFQQALEIYKKIYGPWHTSVAATLNNLGNALTDLEHYLDAEKSFSKAMTIAQAIRDSNLSWHIWDGFRNLFSTQEKIQAAIFFGKQAVFTIQSMRDSFLDMPQELLTAFVKSKADVYRALADLLIQEGRLNEAQWVLRMLKEEEYFQVTLSSASRGGNVTTAQIVFSEMEQSWMDQYQTVQTQLMTLSKEHQILLNKDMNERLTEKELDRLDNLETLLDKSQEYVQSYIGQLIGSFDQIPDSSRQKELSEKQLGTIKGMKHTLKQLGEDVVLIHYIVMPDRIHILLTSPEIQIARESKIHTAQLNQTIFAFRKAIEERKTHLHEAQLLYQWLIAPIALDLEQTKARVLMLSLDEMLRYAPFGAFHTGRKYLAQIYQTAVYTEAARDKINRLPDRTGKIAGVGLSNACPQFNLPALRAVPEEIEAIVLHGPDDASGLISGIVNLNERFSLKSFRRILRRQYAYLHIASHFVLVPGDEKSSFLILGDQTTINLIDIEKKCDFNGIHLLTLSACNTAMGSSGHSGREIEGFAAMAQNNGAQSVLASLWAVNDSSTGLFMQKFYSNFANDAGQTKANALQQTQMFFLNHSNHPEYKHPFFWAPFILMGNWQ